MKSIFKFPATAALLAVALLFSVGCSRGDRTVGQSVDDAALSTKVKAAFAQDPGVKAMDVKVDTYRGTVQLNGWVNTAEEKARAEEIAKTVPGTKAVQNQISVKTDINKTPATTVPAPAPKP